MKKFFALVLSAVLLVGALAACGGDKEAASGDGLEGTWRAELDFTDMMNQQIAAQAAGMEEYIKISGFNMVMVMELNGDGTYSLTVDEDALADSMESVKENMKDGMDAYFQDTLGVSLEDILATQGMSVDDLMDQFDVSAMTGEVKAEGQYKADGDKLYMSGSLDEAPDSNYLAFEQSGNSLSLNIGNGQVPSGMEDFLPLEFDRA